MGLFYFAFCAVNHLLTFFVPINHLTSFVHLSLRSQAVGAETSSLLAQHQLLELSSLLSKWGTNTAVDCGLQVTMRHRTSGSLSAIVLASAPAMSSPSAREEQLEDRTQYIIITLLS